MSLFSRQSAKSCVSFGRLLWARVNHDRVSMMAGSLAYISAFVGSTRHGYFLPVRGVSDVWRSFRAAKALYLHQFCPCSR